MTNFTLISTIFLISFTACDKKNELTKEEEQQQQIMNEMYEEIQVISNSEQCNIQQKIGLLQLWEQKLVADLLYILHTP